MAERMLRGSRLGAVSYESDRNTELAPRQTREYLCGRGHQFEVPFAVDAEVPITWECKFDGTVARLVDGNEPEAKKATASILSAPALAVVVGATAARRTSLAPSSCGHAPLRMSSALRCATAPYAIAVAARTSERCCSCSSA